VIKTVGDAGVLEGLVRRLNAVRPETPRRWGTLTAHEMLCHLGDAAEMVLLVRPRQTPARRRWRPVIKGLGLWSPFRWPHGWRTNPHHDPRDRGTRPTDFARDLARAVSGLEAIARVRGAVEPAHGFFGTMSVRDWQRWAYKHTDHHLRQFGL
jgi:hypothetical protein